MKLSKSTFYKGAEYNHNVNESKDLANNLSWELWFNGYPVASHQLWEFLTKLEQEIPDIKLYPSAKKFGGTGYDVFTAVMEGQPFVLGRVSYADHSIKKDKGAKYTIHSARIRNDKYNVHRDQYHMVMANDIKSAVKQAKKYIRPYTALDLAQMMYSSVYNNAAVFKSKLYDQARDLMNGVGVSGGVNKGLTTIVAEVKNLKDQGVVLRTKWLESSMENVDEAFKILSEYEEYVPKASFVMIEAGSSPMVHVLNDDGILFGTESNGVFKQGETNSYRISELPEHIAGRLAVLQVLNDEQYVERVGYKHDEYIYWIEQV